MNGRSSPHQSRFERVDDWLTRTTGLWRPRPFVQLPAPWEDDLPELSAGLRALELEEACFLEENPSVLARRVPAAAPLVERNRGLSDWPSLEGSPGLELPKHPPRFVPQRKWRQISAFVRVLQGQAPSGVETWVDWCAGKGHLGRTLASVSRARALGVEKRRRLCDSGRELAEREGVPMDFRCADVLTGSFDDVLGPSAAAVALHACGELHVALMRSVVARRARFVAVAPCCYQRIGGAYYEPLSRAAKESRLRLHRHDLRLACLQEVVAGQGERRLRKRAEAYRLSFELLTREAGDGPVESFGRLPRSFFRLPFSLFAARAAEQAGVRLPHGWDAEAVERAGWERLRVATSLGIVRGLFRRAIESWLLLDRALFLEEHGYRAHVGAFCEKSVTPRNLMLSATLI